MPAPDYAQEIATLEKGLGKGVARVESDGEAVTYRGVEQIMKALGYFREMARQGATISRPASTLAVYRGD